MWLTRLLGIAGILEIAVALILIVDPSAAALMLLNSRLDVAGELVGRIAGGALLALGIACWFARSSPTAPATMGVAWALLAYNVVACITLAWAGAVITGIGYLAWLAATLHGLFSIALLAVLLRRHD